MPTPRKYSSISQETYLSAALSSSASTMTVNDASILFSGINSIASGEYFTVVIDPDTALEEIVDVKYPSAAGNNTLTIDRGRDGSQAIAHSPAAKVRHMGIGRDFREANEHINQTTGTAHGLVLADVVKVTDSGTVTSAMIANNTIADTDISGSAAIAKTKIAGTAITAADSGTVTTAMIANGTIIDEDINASAGIALSKLATNPLARANHTGTQAASTISDFDTQVRTNRLDQMAAPAASVSANSQKITNLATPTSGTDASTKAYVDAQITNLIGTSPTTLDTLGEIAAAINSDPNLYSTLNNSKLNRDGSQAMTGALSMGTNKITNLVDPTSAQEAATKNYVDTGANSQVAAAAVSANAAATSATNAATSASAAAASASAASGSATNAANSATSATNTLSSITNLTGAGLVRDMGDITTADTTSTSYINLVNLESSTTAAASAASTSATNANASASAASTSATNASTSATNAANSATAAANSATAAATSATTAASFIPSQTGNSGKFLTTDGTSASWVSLSDWGTI